MVSSPLAAARTLLLATAVVATATLPARAAAQVSWTDWTAVGTNTVSGTLDFSGTLVGVTYTGPRYGVQLGCGTNYWTTPDTYTGTGVTNAPGNCEIVQLSTGGLKTVTFSQAVVNPLVAFVSWNSQSGTEFSAPLELVSTGCGYWGCGAVSVTGDVLNSSGEAHGTIRLVGTYTSFTFTDDSELWHGITVGAEGLAVSSVPEPGTVALTATGLLALVGVARRRRS